MPCGRLRKLTVLNAARDLGMITFRYSTKTEATHALVIIMDDGKILFHNSHMAFQVPQFMKEKTVFGIWVQAESDLCLVDLSANTLFTPTITPLTLADHNGHVLRWLDLTNVVELSINTCFENNICIPKAAMRVMRANKFTRLPLMLDVRRYASVWVNALLESDEGRTTINIIYDARPLLKNERVLLGASRFAIVNVNKT